jgi:hypothetical protein
MQFRRLAVACLTALALCTAAYVFQRGANNGSEWDILYSQNMPAHPSNDPGDGWYFNFPTWGNGEVDYVQRPIANTIKYGATLKVILKSEVTSGAPEYRPNGYNGTTCLAEGRMRVLLRKGTDLTEVNNRWWSSRIRFRLSPGTQTQLIIPIDKDNWSNVRGQKNETAFKNFLSGANKVGVTFGGCGHAGHGVSVANGTAKFHMYGFVIDNP